MASRVQGVGELAALLDALREAAVGAHNLVELLRSHRVGPRQLARALPACLEGSTPEILSRLGDALVGVLGCPAPALNGLIDRAAVAHRRLAAGQSLRASQLGARSRLELDAAAVTLARDLSVLSRGAELLVAAASPRVVSVELGDLLRDDAGTADGEGGLAIQTDPRVASAMIALARAIAGASCAGVTSRDPDGRVRVTFACGAPFDAAAQAALQPVVATAAAMVGHGLSIGEAHVELLF